MSRRDAITASFAEWYESCQVEIKRRFEHVSTIDLKLIKDMFIRNQIMLRHKKTTGSTFFKFKYHAHCNFSKDFTLACRGTTLIINDGDKKEETNGATKEETKSLCEPSGSSGSSTPLPDGPTPIPAPTWIFSLNKFFNAHELPKHLGFELPELMTLLLRQGYSFFHMPKWDGSCIQTTWIGDRFLVTTLGSLECDTIKMQGAVDTSPTWYDKVMSLLTEKDKQVLKENPDHSAIWELIDPLNKIVTNYSERSMLCPIVDIDSDGRPGQSLFAKMGRLPITWEMQIPPQTQPQPQPQSSGSSSSSSLSPTPSDVTPTITQDFLDREYGRIMDYIKLNPSVYGTDPEGLVLYATDGKFTYPITKIKEPSYLQKHLGVCLNIGGERDLCRMQVLMCQGKSDDVVEPIRKAHLTEFHQFLQGLGTELVDTNTWETLTKFSQEDKKAEFANTVRKSLHIPAWLQQILFRSRDTFTKSKSRTEVIDFIIHALGSPIGSGHTNKKGEGKEQKILIETLQIDHNPFWYQPKKKVKVLDQEDCDAPGSESKIISVRVRLPYENENNTNKEKVTSLTPEPTPEATSQPNPEPNSTTVVISDFDGTLVPIYDDTDYEAKFEITPDHSGSVRKTNQLGIHQTALDMLRSYQAAGCIIIILTGRPSTLKHNIITELNKLGITPHDVQCNASRILGHEIKGDTEPKTQTKSKREPTITFKKRYLDMYLVGNHARTIYHMEDHEAVLRNGLILVNLYNHGKSETDRTRYVPIFMQNGVPNNLPNIPRPIVVTLVQPRSTGKHQVFDRLNERCRLQDPNRTCLTVEVDAEITGEPREARFSRCIKEIDQGIRDGSVVFVHSVNESASMLKHIQSVKTLGDCETLVMSGMLVDPKAQTRKEKELKIASSDVVATPGYIETLTTTRENKTQGPGDKKIMLQSITGCVNQINSKQRGIKLCFPPEVNPDLKASKDEDESKVHIPIASVTAIESIVWSELKGLLSAVSEKSHYYLGILMPLSYQILNITPPFLAVPQQHITIVSPTMMTNRASTTLVGKRYSATLSRPVIHSVEYGAVICKVSLNLVDPIVGGGTDTKDTDTKDVDTKDVDIKDINLPLSAHVTVGLTPGTPPINGARLFNDYLMRPEHYADQDLVTLGPLAAAVFQDKKNFVGVVIPL